MEDKFPIFIVGAFAAVLLALILIIGLATLARYERIAQAIANGADPIAARCAFDSATESAAICAQVAARR